MHQYGSRDRRTRSTRDGIAGTFDAPPALEPWTAPFRGPESGDSSGPHVARSRRDTLSPCSPRQYHNPLMIEPQGLGSPIDELSTSLHRGRFVSMPVRKDRTSGTAQQLRDDLGEAVRGSSEREDVNFMFPQKPRRRGRRLHALLDLLVQLVELRLHVPGVVALEEADIDRLRGLNIECRVVNRQFAV